MGYHALLAPSSAYRYLECAASVYQDKKHRDDTVELVAADQGTVAHYIADLWFNELIADFADVKGNEYYVIDGSVQDVRDFDEPLNLTKHIVDQTMIASLCAYADAIMRQYESLDRETRGIGFEIKVPIDHVTTEPGARGTADVIMFDHEVIEVHDLKYGFNEVDSADNPQLKTYALGAVRYLLESNMLLMTIPDDMLVMCVIHQPRVKDRPDVSEYTVGELKEWANTHKLNFTKALRYYHMLEEDKGKLEHSEAGRPYYQAGGHCQYCSYAAKGCKYLIEHTLEVAEKSAEIVKFEETIDTSGVPTLIRFFEMLPVLKTLGIAVEQELLGRLMRGEKVPGYKLGQGREGNRAWNVDEDTLVKEFLSMGMTSDQVYVNSLISPAELSRRVKGKLIPKELAVAIEGKFISRAAGKAKLVPTGRDVPDFDLDASRNESMAGLTALD